MHITTHMHIIVLSQITLLKFHFDKFMDLNRPISLQLLCISTTSLKYYVLFQTYLIHISYSFGVFCQRNADRNTIIVMYYNACPECPCTEGPGVTVFFIHDTPLKAASKVKLCSMSIVVCHRQRRGDLVYWFQTRPCVIAVFDAFSLYVIIAYLFSFLFDWFQNRRRPRVVVLVLVHVHRGPYVSPQMAGARTYHKWDVFIDLLRNW